MNLDVSDPLYPPLFKTFCAPPRLISCGRNGNPRRASDSCEPQLLPVDRNGSCPATSLENEELVSRPRQAQNLDGDTHVLETENRVACYSCLLSATFADYPVGGRRSFRTECPLLDNPGQHWGSLCGARLGFDRLAGVSHQLPRSHGRECGTKS